MSDTFDTIDTDMTELPTHTKSAGTRLDPSLYSELERVAAETGLSNADLLRIGLRRLIAAYKRDGKIELGSDVEELTTA